MITWKRVLLVLLGLYLLLNLVGYLVFGLGSQSPGGIEPNW